jgi:hypothetical protein
MLLFIFLPFVVHGASEAIPEPIFKTTPPKKEKVMVEDLYFFTVKEYLPPVKVEFVKRSEASYENPEMAAISYISAMALKDFEWARSTWTKESQNILEERDKSLNQTPEFWINIWEKTFKNKKVELTTRVETGEYVLIGYKITPETKISNEPNERTKEDIELVAVLRKYEGIWLATQELAKDPVLHYWKTPEVKVQRVIRE